MVVKKQVTPSRFSITPWFVFIILFICFCTPKVDYKDYGYLTDYTQKNKEQVKELLEFYKDTKGEKRIIVEYILDNLLDQYSCRFFLMNKNDKSLDTLWLSDDMKVDFMELKQSEGYELGADTIYDIDLLYSEDIINAVDHAYKNWNLEGKHEDVEFESYVRSIVAYRTNNEELGGLFDGLGLMMNRFAISELLKINDEEDRLSSYVRLFEEMTEGEPRSSKEVDFFNRPQYYQRYFNDLPIEESEDKYVFTLKLLRHHGIASVSSFAPSIRYSSLPSYGVRPIFQTEKDVIKKAGISKLYRSSFEKNNWTNPYDELRKAGVSPNSIPYSLYIPKMEDVTQEFASAQDIELVVPESLRKNKVLYLGTYSFGKWRPVIWGRVNNSKVIFKNIGTGMLYQGVEYTDGMTRSFGHPFILDSLGIITELGIEKKDLDSLVLTQIGNLRELKTNVRYDVYQLNKVQDWRKVSSAYPNSDGEIILRDIKLNSIFKILESTAISHTEKGYRIFTVTNGKQVWW